MRQLPGTVTILSAGLVAGCASHQQPRLTVADSASVQRAEERAELAAIKAVLRAVRAQWKPEPGWERPTFYLSWLRSPPDYDPPSWALAEFNAEPYSLRKASRHSRDTCWGEAITPKPFRPPRVRRKRVPCGVVVELEGVGAVSSTQVKVGRAGSR